MIKRLRSQPVITWVGLGLIGLSAYMLVVQSQTRTRMNASEVTATSDAAQQRAYVKCNERRRGLYLHGELAWFNALHAAERLRVPEFEAARIHARRVAFDIRERDLNAYLRLKCAI